MSNVKVRVFGCVISCILTFPWKVLPSSLEQKCSSETTKHIAHLRQECHKSKFGIFELMV